MSKHKKYKLPLKSQIISEFKNRNNLTDEARVDWVESGIYWFCTIQKLLSEAFEHYKVPAIENDHTQGILTRMLRRVLDHTEAALVISVTSFPASAEALCRIAIESAVNLSHILSGNRLARLQAYIESYLNGVDNQLRKWERTAEQEFPGQHLDYLIGHKTRSEVNEYLKNMMDFIFKEMRKETKEYASENWPNSTFDRFKALNLSIQYRTIYARLCSEVHNDAEEIVRWMVGKQMDEILQSDQPRCYTTALEQESYYFSRMMVYYACLYTIKTVILYAECYNYKSIIGRLQRGCRIIEQEILSILPLTGYSPE